MPLNYSFMEELDESGRKAVATPPPARGGIAYSAPAPQPRDTDTFGVGVNPTAPAAVGSARPTTPEEAAQIQRESAARKVAEDARNTANTNLPYQGIRGAADAASLHNQASDGSRSFSRAGIELPFIGDIPGIGNTLEGGFSGAQSGLLAAGQDIVDNPGLNLATGGASAIFAGGDAAIDDLATGVVRDATGNEHGQVNVPLTPAQMWDPNGPLYDAANGGAGNINIPGIRDIGEGIVEGANDLGGAIGGIFGGGGGGAGGGGAAGAGYGYDVAKAAIENAAREQAGAKQLGADVLSGRVGAPNPADRALQANELGRAQGFATGPRATQGALGDIHSGLRQPGSQQGVLADANRTRALPGAQEGVLGDVDSFLQSPTGPSAAELQLKQAQDDAMSDALSLARGTRGGAGATNRAMRVAIAENAATQSGAARDMALLRAKEEEANRAQTLSALGLKGDVAGGVDQRDLTALGIAGDMAGGVDQRQIQGLGLELEGSRGIDQDTLSSLGISSGLASDIRGQGVQERGQTLGAGAGLVSDALGSTTNIASTAIPAYLKDDLDRDKLGYELTPDQKMLFAGLGAGSDLLSMFL